MSHLFTQLLSKLFGFVLVLISEQNCLRVKRLRLWRDKSFAPVFPSACWLKIGSNAYSSRHQFYRRRWQVLASHGLYCVLFTAITRNVADLFNRLSTLRSRDSHWGHKLLCRVRHQETGYGAQQSARYKQATWTVSTYSENLPNIFGISWLKLIYFLGNLSKYISFNLNIKVIFPNV